MRVNTDLPRRVRELEHVWIPPSDATQLAARIWLHECADEDPVPAILEDDCLDVLSCCLMCNSIKSGRTYEEAAPQLLASLRARQLRAAG